MAEERPGVLAIPAASVIHEGSQAAVVTAGSDGKAHRREVTTGLEGGGDIEIRSGLVAGDEVVVRGQEALPDGAAITIAR
jgi:multidrug efflux pump subunit AcrA (membrane-fusion protein)